MKTRLGFWLVLGLVAAACQVNVGLEATATVAPASMVAAAASATASGATFTPVAGASVPRATTTAAPTTPPPLDTTTFVTTAAPTWGAATTAVATAAPPLGVTSAPVATSLPPVAATPTAALAFVFTPTSSPPALTFILDRAPSQPGEMVTLRWSTGAAVTGTVSISLRAAHGAQPGLNNWRDLPAQGSLDVALDVDPRGRYLFGLGASFAADPSYYTVPFRFPCPDRFFFQFPANWQDGGPLSYDRCPAAPAHTPAALEQAFEGGRMLWLQTDGLILVLYGDGRTPGQPNDWWYYTDTWTGAEPETDPRFAAPEGRWVPRRGFGKVWVANEDVRQRLGWALAPEHGFISADQRDWDVPGHGSPEFRFVRAADGSILALTDYAGHGIRPYWQVVVGP